MTLFFLRFLAWGLQWSVAAAFCLAVMGGAGYYVFSEGLAGGQHVTVPNLVNQSITDATLRLGELGLDMGKQTLVPHATVPKYHIIAQRPAAGRVVRTGRKVYPIVSMGTNYLSAPNYLQMSLESAQRDITQSQFRLGTVARIPNAAPRDAVLAQDPPPDQPIPNEGTIHLLVSAGQDKASAFMPTIRGLSVSEALRVLAPYGVTMVPNLVDTPGASLDVVLDQRPQPDTLIYEGQVVTYDVKSSGNVTLPDSHYTGEVVHVMPYDWYDRDVRVEVIDYQGNREVKFTKPRAVDAQARATYVTNSKIRVPVSYVGEATVEVYVDDNKVASYLLKAGADPVRTGP